MILRTAGVCIERNGRNIVDNVSVSFAAGHVAAVCGANGSGKSSLLKALSGEWKPSAGHVTIAGENTAKMSPIDLSRRRAVLPQDMDVPFDFTAFEVVALGRYPWAPEPRVDQIQFVRRALDNVEARHLEHRAFPSLSGGEKQRVQLARVWAQMSGVHNGVTLLDEPTSALDPRHQHLVFASLRKRAASGFCVVVVVHDLQLAYQYADDVLLLSEGKVVHWGPPRDTLSRSNVRDAFNVDAYEVAHPGGTALVTSRIV